MEFKADCSDCGHSLCEHDGKQSGFARCPSCHATTRHFIGVAEEQIEITPALDSRRETRTPDQSRRQARKGAEYIEILSGDDWWRDGGKFNYRYREVNKKIDRYREIVMDLETGEVLRHCDEPLSEHR